MKVLCNQCRESIKDYGAPFVMLYEHIINLTSNYEAIVANERKSDSAGRSLLKLMESKKLIQTCECSEDEVYVRLNWDILSVHEEHGTICFLNDDSHFENECDTENFG
jgi:hypothetical protein